MHILLRLRQFWCGLTQGHEWSCGEAHWCLGDHYCVRCFKTGSRFTQMGVHHAR